MVSLFHCAPDLVNSIENDKSPKEKESNDSEMHSESAPTVDDSDSVMTFNSDQAAEKDIKESDVNEFKKRVQGSNEVICRRIFES